MVKIFHHISLEVRGFHGLYGLGLGLGLDLVNISGLSSSTVVFVVILPVIYYGTNKERKKESRRERNTAVEAVLARARGPTNLTLATKATLLNLFYTRNKNPSMITVQVTTFSQRSSI